MRITWLLEAVDQLWGGVKVALEDANWLHRRGHQVTVLSRSGPPSWMRIECAFQRVQDFRPEHLPPADVVIGTFWTTVPWAASAGPGKGMPVHLCQGYEGDFPEHAQLRDRIESVYRLPHVRHLTVAPYLTQLLETRFGIHAAEVDHVIDHDVHQPGPERAPGSVLRVGLVGPWQVGWKDLPTGYAACELAHRAGQKLVLVRATNTAPDPAEQKTSFPVEWHRQVPPARMGDFYRSLDVFLGTSSGTEEGFFLPAIEAMACGVPSILTDVPCFRSHGTKTGNHNYALFVPAKDPAAMAEALVIAGGMPDVRSELRRSGLQLASCYRQERHGQQLEAALQRFAAAAPAVATPTAPREPAPLRLVPSDDAPDQIVHGLRQDLRTAGERLRAAGHQRHAADVFAAAACLDGVDARAKLESASTCLQQGDTTGALRIFDGLLSAGCDEEALHVGRGHALHAQGRLQEAAQAFRTALAVGTRSADAYNRLGVVLFQSGDLHSARQHFERALMLQPDHDDARANLEALPAA